MYHHASHTHFRLGERRPLPRRRGVFMTTLVVLGRALGFIFRMVSRVLAFLVGCFGFFFRVLFRMTDMY